jgi:hypothetical protein
MPKNQDNVKRRGMSRQELEDGYARLCDINEHLSRINAEMIASQKEIISGYAYGKTAALALQFIAEKIENGGALVAWAVEQGAKETGLQLPTVLTDAQGVN